MSTPAAILRLRAAGNSHIPQKSQKNIFPGKYLSSQVVKRGGVTRLVNFSRDVRPIDDKFVEISVHSMTIPSFHCEPPLPDRKRARRATTYNLELVPLTASLSLDHRLSLVLVVSF